MQDLFDLSGKVAIVTGASRGLGQYFGRALAKAGADLVITSRKLSSLTEFKKEIESLGRKALAVQVDVLSQSDIENMVRMAIEEYGGYDIASKGYNKINFTTNYNTNTFNNNIIVLSAITTYASYKNKKTLPK